MKHLTEQLAKKGRFGDDRMLHVSRHEISGLEALIGRPLPTNPDTGAKEAFFFLPFLAGLGALAAPATAATLAATAPLAAAGPAMAAAGAGAAGLGALGAGINAGIGAASGLGAAGAAGAAGLGAAAAGALPAATTAAGAAGAAGLGAAGTGALALPAASAIPTAALTAAPQAAATTGGLAAALNPLTATTGGSLIPSSAIPGGGLAALQAPVQTAGLTIDGFIPTNAASAVSPLQATGMTNMGATPMNTLAATPDATAPSFVESVQTTTIPSGKTPVPVGSKPPPELSGIGPYSNPPPTQVSAAPTNTAALDTGNALNMSGTPTESAGGLGSLFGGMDPTMMAMMASGMMGGGGGGGGDDDEDSKKQKKTAEDNVKTPYLGGDPKFPGSSYNPGFDGEWNYFPTYKVKFAEGGSVKKYGPQDSMGWAEDPLMMGIMTLGQGLGLMDNGIVSTAKNNNLDAGEAIKKMKAGMGRKGYAQGGMVQPDQQNPMMPPTGIAAMAPQAPPMGQAPEPGAIPESPYPRQQVGSESENDKELIAQTVQAIKGQSPNPDQVLMAFVDTFGEQALQDLVARVRGLDAKASGQNVQSMGDGMSDSIPAHINGQQPAALSEGEYVIPADVVSGLGNGSTAAGARHLDRMANSVRKARTGSTQQATGIDALQHLPA